MTIAEAIVLLVPSRKISGARELEPFPDFCVELLGIGAIISNYLPSKVRTNLADYPCLAVPIAAHENL